MKVVVDTMIWLSYAVSPNGFRRRLIATAQNRRVRLFVSDYILNELEETLVEDFGRTRRFARMARRAVLRIAKRVKLPDFIPRHVPGDPLDDPIVQTALTSKSHYLVTADKEILKLRKVQGVAMLSPSAFAMQLDIS